MTDCQHRCECCEGVVVTFEPLVSEGQEVAVFQSLRVRRCLRSGRFGARESSEDCGRLLVLFPFNQRTDDDPLHVDLQIAVRKTAGELGGIPVDRDVVFFQQGDGNLPVQRALDPLILPAGGENLVELSAGCRRLAGQE